jgi:hypothetical protein
MRLASSCAPSERLPRGYWRFVWLLAAARHSPGSGRPSGTRASRRIHRPPRRQFAASTEMPRATRSFEPPGSWIVPTSRRAAAAGLLPAPRPPAAADDRTSAPPTQNSECVHPGPMAACDPHTSNASAAFVPSEFPQSRACVALSTYFSTLHFALSTFLMGGRHAQTRLDVGGWPCGCGIRLPG